MTPPRQPTVSQLRRRCYAALAGALIASIAGWIAPTPVSAHSDGHTCSASSVVPPSGWACTRQAVEITIGSERVDTRRILYWYNGTSIGSAQLNMYDDTNDVHSVSMCDSANPDSFSPRLRVESVIGNIREFAAPTRDCHTTPGSQINIQVRRYRGLTRNSTTGSVQHGTIWYLPYPG